MSGPAGHTGPTGATGRRGLQGTPYGPPGTSFYSTSGRIITATPDTGGAYINLSTDTFGTVYLLVSGQDTEVVAPAKVEQIGGFWTIRNNTGANRVVNFGKMSSNGVYYNGTDFAGFVTLGAGNSLTLVISAASADVGTYVLI
jgi:hypothetical protein